MYGLMNDESLEDALSLIMERIATDSSLILHAGTFIRGMFSGLEQELLESLENETLDLMEVAVLNSALESAENHFEVWVYR